MEPPTSVARHRAMHKPARSSAVALLPLVAALLVGACGPGGLTPAATPSIDTPEAAAAEIQARTPLFDGIGKLDPDMIGADRWWEAEPLAAPSTGWAVTFVVGWGDCPAGCIDRHSWTWNVARDGAVTFVAEAGSVLTGEILTGMRNAAKGTDVGGRVTAGPTCPVERPNDPACAPRLVKGAVLVVRNASGGEVVRLTTDGSGLFRVALKPGEYTLEPQAVEGFMGTAKPMPFTLRDGDFAWLDVSYDTGIR